MSIIKDWMKANVSQVEMIVFILTLLVSISMLYEIYILTNTSSILTMVFAVVILFIKIYVFVVGAQIIIKLNKDWGELHAITTLVIFVLVMVGMLPVIWC